MALFITYHPPLGLGDQGPIQREYHVQDFSKEHGADVQARININGTAIGVEYIQADGDELEYIIKKFAGIPVCVNQRVVRWYGDHAKFIVGNL